MGREHAYTFRARSHDEMMEWWNDIKQLSKVYLTTSEQMDRSGIVPAAVRAAVTAPRRRTRTRRTEAPSRRRTTRSTPRLLTRTSTTPLPPPSRAPRTPLVPRPRLPRRRRCPAYTGGAASTGEVGPNGYLLEKKGESAQAGEPSQDGLNRSASSAGKEKAPRLRLRRHKCASDISSLWTARDMATYRYPGASDSISPHLVLLRLCDRPTPFFIFCRFLNSDAPLFLSSLACKSFHTPSASFVDGACLSITFCSSHKPVCSLQM